MHKDFQAAPPLLSSCKETMSKKSLFGQYANIALFVSRHHHCPLFHPISLFLSSSFCVHPRVRCSVHFGAWKSSITKGIVRERIASRSGKIERYAQKSKGRKRKGRIYFLANSRNLLHIWPLLLSTSRPPSASVMWCLTDLTGWANKHSSEQPMPLDSRHPFSKA